MRIDVEAIEQELGRIQRELTNTEVRTSLFTLVVVSSDAQAAMSDAALAYLLGKRAARVIHVVNDKSRESDIEVSARCFIDEQRKGVCFQEIIITNGSDNSGGAPGTWIPLLIRDLPTYVLWLDTITDKLDILRNALEQADKLLVDSDHLIALGESPDEVLQLLRTLLLSEQVLVADFAWKRIVPFRRLTAMAFDSDERIDWLPQIASVEISGLGQASSALYGLWLAERLGWKHTNNGYRDSANRDIVFGATSQDASECEIAVQMSLANGETIHVVAHPHGCVDVESSDGASSKRVVLLPTNGESLLEEVDSVHTDSLYRAALSVW